MKNTKPDAHPLSSAPTERLERIRELDRAVAKASAPIKVLKHLGWPKAAGNKFLEAWRSGRPELPKVELPAVSYAQEIAALESIAAACDRSDPLASFVRATALSYVTAARMLEGIGTPEFTRHSTILYGAPKTPWPTQTVDGVDAARHMLETTDRLLGGYRIPPTVCDIPAVDFAARLRTFVDAFFQDDPVDVVLDDGLPSKAVAGSKRIRLRASATFSELDLDQLLEHEAYVHTATILNGHYQSNLGCLGLGAPRTTRAQEGLATLAELMTMSIDVLRLRRLAIRVIAVQKALDGGDFIDVFREFLEAGQTEDESFQSAQRIFRGGDVRGRVAFTKDSGYLRGLLETHSFMRVIIRDNRPELFFNFLAGRMTLGDAVLLAPEFDAGVLTGPHYVPPWARDLRRVAAVSVFGGFIGQIDLAKLTLERLVLRERELAAADG
jgi:uncharacterized protein (TIGR02421 family)